MSGDDRQEGAGFRRNEVEIEDRARREFGVGIVPGLRQSEAAAGVEGLVEYGDQRVGGVGVAFGLRGVSGEGL